MWKVTRILTQRVIGKLPVILPSVHIAPLTSIAYINPNRSTGPNISRILTHSLSLSPSNHPTPPPQCVRSFTQHRDYTVLQRPHLPLLAIQARPLSVVAAPVAPAASSASATGSTGSIVFTGCTSLSVRAFRTREPKGVKRKTEPRKKTSVCSIF